MLEGVPQDEEFLQTQVSLLSSSYAQRVVEELDLDSYAHLRARLEDEDLAASALAQLPTALSDLLVKTWAAAAGVAGSITRRGLDTCAVDDPALCELLEDAGAPQTPSPEAAAADPIVRVAVKEVVDGLRVQRIEKSYMIRISATSPTHGSRPRPPTRRRSSMSATSSTTNGRRPPGR